MNTTSSTARPACLVFLLLLGLAGPGGAHAAAPVSTDEASSMTLGPPGDVYPDYIADPHRATNSLQNMFFDETEIFDAGDERFGLKLGGRFGILRFHPDDRPDRGFQINILGGFVGQFDKDHSTDNIGWNGIYGLIFTWKPRGRLHYKFGVHHISSHIGDEYAERTGRLRIDYTREEFQFGVAAPFAETWIAYGEAGYAYGLDNEGVQERGRLQAGVQWESASRFWKDRVGLYGAADLSSYEERNWNVNVALQGGLHLANGNRTWRLGAEVYDGRSILGEFFLQDERHVALGLWLDL